MSDGAGGGGPLWRRGFDTVEGAMRPRLEDVIGTEQFAVAAGLLAQVQRTLQRTTERATRRALHSFNLPAGSDVNRILAELGRLERQLASLRRELDQAKRAGRPGDRAENGAASKERPTDSGSANKGTNSGKTNSEKGGRGDATGTRTKRPARPSQA